MQLRVVLWLLLCRSLSPSSSPQLLFAAFVLCCAVFFELLACEVAQDTHTHTKQLQVLNMCFQAIFLCSLPARQEHVEGFFLCRAWVSRLSFRTGGQVSVFLS